MPRKRREIHPKSAERLRELMIDFRITQIDLAKKINCHPKTINAIANGHQAMSIDIASDIEREFKPLRAAWLTGESDLKYSDHEDYVRSRIEGNIDHCFYAFYHSLGFEFAASFNFENPLKETNMFIDDMEDIVKERKFIDNSKTIIFDSDRSKVYEVDMCFSDVEESLLDQVSKYTRFLIQELTQNGRERHDIAVPDNIKESLLVKSEMDSFVLGDSFKWGGE